MTVQGEKILRFKVKARGLTPDAPHAQHIHYGEQARNECPGLDLDTNGDGRLNTLEGVPAYGPVVVSLTTRGDTTPASLLAVDRFPIVKHGRLDYRRSDIRFTDVAGTGYPGRAAPAPQPRSPTRSARAKASWSSTGRTTTATAPTASAPREPASSTPPFPPRPPTPRSAGFSADLPRPDPAPMDRLTGAVHRRACRTARRAGGR